MLNEPRLEPVASELGGVASRSPLMLGQLGRDTLLSGLSPIEEILDSDGEKACSQARDQFLKILFALPVIGISGGTNVIIQEARALASLGIKTHVAIPDSARCDFIDYYPEAARDGIFVSFSGDSEFVRLSQDYTHVVATIYRSMSLVAEACESNPSLQPAYYVQDYEPSFFEHGSEARLVASQSYTLLPGTLLLGKSSWVRNQVRLHHGAEVQLVSPSVDHEVYWPRHTEELSPQAYVPVVVAMVRPQTARRNAEFTMRVLAEVAGQLRGHVRVRIFGVSTDHESFQELQFEGFDYECLGVLDRQGVASLLRSSDVFLDYSKYQAMGLTTLEAMASGCAVVVPRRGGSVDFAYHEKNSLIVDTDDLASCVEAAISLSDNPVKRKRIATAALKTAERFHPERAAVDLLRLFLGWRRPLQ